MNRKNKPAPIGAWRFSAKVLLTTLLVGLLLAAPISACAEEFPEDWFSTGTILDDPALYMDEGTNVTTPSNMADPSDQEEPGPEQSTTEKPTPDEPQAPDPEFEILIRQPSSWGNGNSVKVRVEINDIHGAGWKKIEVRINNGEWIDMTKAYLEDGELLLELADNGRVTVRVMDMRGGYHNENETIRCIDREAPTLTAAVDDGRLHVSTADDLSGVAGIRVNGYLFANLQNGVLDMDMETLLTRYEQLEITAFDYAGNTSPALTLTNPYYCTPTPMPTETPAPTVAPTAKKSSSSTKKKATAAPTEEPTPEPTPVVTEAPQVSVQTYPPYYPYPYPYQPTEPTLSPGTAFNAEGNMRTLDLLYSQNTNKQFITVQSRNGETYFLVIDYDKPIDEENDLYETYFLNLVDDRDLLAVLDEADMPTATPVIIEVTPQPTTVPTAVPILPEPEKSNGMSGLAAIASLLILAGIGAAAFFYLRQNTKGKQKSNDYGFDDDEDEDEDEDEDSEDI